MKALGAKKDPHDRRDYSVQQLSLPSQLERAVNYRDQMTPVKDQGSAGFCVSFAVLAVQEALEKIHRPWRLPVDDLSELDLHRRVKQIDPWEGQGTSPRYALKVMQKEGVTIEKACSYEDEWPIEKEATWWGCGLRRFEKIGDYHRIHSIDEARKFLSSHHPFVLGVPVTPNFMKDEGIIIRSPSQWSVVGGHAVCVCGYNDDGLWIKSSWGSSYRDSGYAIISYDYLRNSPWTDFWGWLLP